MPLIVNGVEIENLIVINSNTGEQVEIDKFQDSLGNIIFEKGSNVLAFQVHIKPYTSGETLGTDAIVIGITHQGSTGNYTLDYNYDFDIDWGDGTVEHYDNDKIIANLNSNAFNGISHTYPAVDAYYDIVITGLFEQGKIQTGQLTALNNALTKITSFNSSLKTLESMFSNCKIDSDTTITLPVINAPDCISAKNMFSSTDAKAFSDARKLGKIILPNGVFAKLKKCTNFYGVFQSDADYDDGSKINDLKLEIQGKIFPESVEDLTNAFRHCKIVSKIPDDFLYDLPNITTLAGCFWATDNSGFTLPDRFMPKDMSKVTDMNWFMAIESTNGDDNGSTTYHYPALFYGKMEEVWNRSDLTSLTVSDTIFYNTTTLDNYNEIPADWGGGGA
jgi:hypothetical protein